MILDGVIITLLIVISYRVNIFIYNTVWCYMFPISLTFTMLLMLPLDFLHKKVSAIVEPKQVVHKC